MLVGRKIPMNDKALREIYREAFGDDGEFEDDLFTMCGEYLRSASCGKETAAMLFALPCKIVTPEKSFSAFYLYGAATKKAYLGQGYMSGLIKTLIKEGKPIFLKPAEDNLLGFYERLGFKRFTAVSSGKNEKAALPLDGFARLAADTEAEKALSYTAMSIGSPIPLDGLFFPFTME